MSDNASVDILPRAADVDICFRDDVSNGSQCFRGIERVAQRGAEYFLRLCKSKIAISNPDFQSKQRIPHTKLSIVLPLDRNDVDHLEWHPDFALLKL